MTLYDDRATDVLDHRPSCNMCSEPAVADAKTLQGPWAYLCAIHFITSARGLGLGVGQILLCGDELDAGLRMNLEGQAAS